MAQGLSLKGLAALLNADHALGTDRKISASWIHHLENGRAKMPSTALKKALARALKQEESKYLGSHEFSAKGPHGFAKYFEDQLGSFETGSTLIADFCIEPERVAEVGELLLCLYQFLVVSEGRLVVFERSEHLSLPVLLLAIRSWPGIDDVNPNEVVSKVLAPAAAGGFLTCPLPAPTAEALAWVTSRVEIHEPMAHETVAALLDSDPFSRLGVISPAADGMPKKRFFYYLNPQEFGPLRDRAADMASKRFSQYRDLELFTRYEYESGFGFSYPEMAKPYHLHFDDPPARLAGASGS